MKLTNNSGTAYGFFYYQGETRNILKVLPEVREKAVIPPEVSLNLVEGMDNVNLQNDSALVEIIEKAKRQHLSHALKATWFNVGNHKVAQELADVLNGIYLTLYEQTEPFYTGIVYQRGERYVFKK